VTKAVSIIIPCYKQAEYLPEAIESALSQTVPVEVIVVNDGSPDNTTEVSLKYPVKLIVQQNLGLGAARNSGIALSRCNYVVPLDADDRIDPKFVEKCLGRFADGVALVGTGMKTFGDCERTDMPPDNVTVDDLWPYNRIYCCSMFPKCLWQELGGYDEYISSIGAYEDWELWLRLLRKGRFALIPEYLFFYRKHGRSMVDEAIEKHDDLVTYIKSKHASLLFLK
jgi:glycosyltransferase involved in cell wall biosynthesis